MSQNKNSIKGFVLADSSTKGGQYVANWRVFMPDVDETKCTGCRLCLLYCPEGAIHAEEGEKPEIDMRFCKGCGICANECTSKAITMKREEVKK